MSTANPMNRSRTSEAQGLPTAADDTRGLRRIGESTEVAVTLRLLTECVGSFEERVSELVEQFGDRFTYLEHAQTQRFANDRCSTEFIESCY
jgi:hypothetical protein